MDLTSRQKQLLLSIISEFTNTAEAVGSISLQSKYSFKVSPATIRNEMAELVLRGYLFQKHNSGGRIPTTKGWRYFVETLDVTGLSDIDEGTKLLIKEDLIKIKTDEEHLVREAIKYLSKISGNAAIALIDKKIYYAGLSEIVNIPEFRENDNLKNILTILEDYYALSEILNHGTHDEEINILIGDEAEVDEFKDYAVVFSELRLFPNQRGYIAVIGPNRMRYNVIIPAVKYIADTIKQVVG